MSSKSAQRLFYIVLPLLTVFFIILSFRPDVGLVKAQNMGEGKAPTWLPDTEVTEVGRNAVRARDLLNFVLKTPTSDFSPIKQAWSISRNIAVSLLLIALIIFGFGIMLRRTETYRVMPYLPVLVLLIIFIFFSYPITVLVIQLIEITQIYLIGKIGAENLLSVNFNYDFIGYRVQDYRYNESAEISLFLTRATSFTYLVMVAILFIRQIILWFLVIFSPFLSIALALPFTRNAGKIWIGEFFRWVLYGPFFAIFLRAIVIVWESGIPLAFQTVEERGFQSPGPYPTAISILLGGPGEDVKISNSLNYVDTYAKYVIALLMLWAAIILPFLLLRIFRDFIANFFKSKEMDIRSWFSKVYPYGKEGKPGPAATAVATATPAPTPAQPPPPPRSWGMTFEAAERPGVARAVVALAREMAAAETAQILQQIGVSYATGGVRVGERRSIANLAQAEMNRSLQTQVTESLNKIRYPAVISNEAERERFTVAVRELATRAAKGDEQAQNVLNAAGVDYQKVLAEQGIKIAAVVGRPLGAGAREEEERRPGFITAIPTVAGVSAEERVTERMSLIRMELSKVADQAESGDENAIRIMNNISTSVSDEFGRVVEERVQREGEENRYQIIKEEVEKVVSLAESGNPEALKSITVVGQSLGVETRVLDKFVAIRSAIEKVSTEAEGGDERAITILNTLSSSLSEETQRVINERIAKEGEETKYQIIREEVENIISLAETGDIESIKKLATVSEALELGFVNNSSVMINNEVSRISSLAESGDEKSVEIVKTIASSFGFDVEREIKKIETTEGFEASVKRIQTEIVKVIHRAESGDPEARDILKSIVTTLGPDFESELEKKDKEVSAQVSLEDYEQVKKMWLNNYRHADVPDDLEIEEREEWLNLDIQKLTNTLEKVTSESPEIKEEGLKMISGILTFVLLGDFSEAEIIAYLKAKLEAAKQVKEEMLSGEKVEEMEEELVEVPQEVPAEEEKKLRAEISGDEDEEDKDKDRRTEEEDGVETSDGENQVAGSDSSQDMEPTSDTVAPGESRE